VIFSTVRSGLFLTASFENVGLMSRYLWFTGKNYDKSW